jgi:two-component system, cell cycle sensor histidine kinase and response regulator CckA
MPSLLGLQPPTLLQTVLDDVGVALAVIGKDGRFTLTNQAALDMFGIEDLSGVSFQEWRNGYRFQDSQGRDIPADEAPLLRALGGEKIGPQDVRITRPDGRHKWLHGSSHPFSVLGLTGVLVVVTDETEAVELRRTAEQFHRMDGVGVLAGGLAHDVNNMLSVVSEHVALALSEPGLAEVTRTRLQQVALTLQKGAALSKRLLQYGGTEKLETRPVQINEVVNTALDLVSPLLESRVRVKTELARGLPIVEADAVEIEQVFVNLIMNALDAMPAGGELMLRSEVATIPSHQGETPGQYVLITVADTGIGIAKDLQSRIFEPCFTTKPGRGAGLGLASVYGIVRQHQGHIAVHSVLGEGAKFCVYLPVMATQPQ